jgi:hypothetical protein
MFAVMRHEDARAVPRRFPSVCTQIVKTDLEASQILQSRTPA